MRIRPWAVSLVSRNVVMHLTVNMTDANRYRPRMVGTNVKDLIKRPASGVKKATSSPAI